MRIDVVEGALATMITVGLMILSPILAQTGTINKLLSSEWARQLWNGLYYALPKVYDIGKLTLDVIARDKFDSMMPVWSSAIFAVVVLGTALFVFQKRDF
jgi:hypothetical protein